MTLNEAIEQLNSILNEHFYVPYPETEDGGILMTDIEARRELVANEVSMLIPNPVIIVQLIQMNSFGNSAEGDRVYEIRKILIDALNILKSFKQLIELVLEKNNEWYVRTFSANGLISHAEVSDLEKLIPVLQEKDTEGEVKGAVLKVLSENNVVSVLPLLDKLLSQKNIDEDWFDAKVQLITAQGRLGEPSVILPLIEKCYDKWGSTRWQGKEALGKFIDKQGGLEETINLLVPEIYVKRLFLEKIDFLLFKSKNSNVRRWAVEIYTNVVKDKLLKNNLYVQKLGDRDWGVRHSAYQQLILDTDTKAALQEKISDDDLTTEQKLWLMLLLFDECPNKIEQLIQSTSDVLVPWDIEVHSSIRKSIVSVFADNVAYAEYGTDVRYFLENKLLTKNSNSSYDINALMVNLKKVLMRFGKNYIDWEEIGEHNQQGSGECFIATIDDFYVYLNKAAPVAIISYFKRDVYEDGWSEEKEFDKSKMRVSSRQTYMKIETILRENNVVVINEEQQKYVVPYLNVYYFGQREPLTIRELITYWQD